MNRNKVIIAIIISFVCIILVAIMLAQFKVVEQTDITGITAAREEELQTMLSSWKTKYDEIQEKIIDTNSKINEYKQTINSSEETSQLLDSELEQTNLLVGKTGVTGEGIVVILQDNNEKWIEARDLRTLMNELKLAGAEAISINDKRIINMTAIVQVGDKILVNEEPISSPYTVKAIGNQKYLSSALSLKTTGFIDTYRQYGKTIEMHEQRNINIAGYNKTMQFKYAKEVK